MSPPLRLDKPSHCLEVDSRSSLLTNNDFNESFKWKCFIHMSFDQQLAAYEPLPAYQVSSTLNPSPFFAV